MITLAGVVFGIVGALAAGVGDFLGGVAARRASPWGVALITWLGQIPIFTVLTFAQHRQINPDQVLPGISAGFASAFAGVLLFMGISRGNVAVVAATSAVMGSTIAVVYDVAMGTKLPNIVWIGFGLAGPAIFLVAGGIVRTVGKQLTSLAQGIGAGVFIGVAYVMIGIGGGMEGEAPLLLVTAITAGSVLLVGSILRRTPTIPSGTALVVSMASALCAGLHLVSFILAVQMGSIATSAVLVSQYPAVTVLMAALVWRQRPSARQVVGIVMALAAVGMIGSGST